jgi:F-type H+-transporting ATPase subunit delta
VSESRVARVYAEALFAAADDAGRVERVQADLGAFDDALRGSPQLRGAMLNPQIDRASKARVLDGLTAGGDQLVVNALRLMLQKGRIALTADMRREFERLAAEAARVVDVEVTSAVPLGDEAEHELLARVRQATGRRVRLVKSIDADVLGGLVLRIGDVVLDASLRARVAQLREQLSGMRGALT